MSRGVVTEMIELYKLFEKEEKVQSEPQVKVLVDIHNQETLLPDKHVEELIEHNYDCLNKRSKS